MIFPCVFALGTAHKPYQSCFVGDLGGYEPSMDACNPDDYPKELMPSQYDLVRSKARSKNAPWSYLLQPRLPGEVHVRSRGKQMVLAAGHVSNIIITLSLFLKSSPSQHAVVIRFALEASLVRIQTSVFFEIISKTVDGPSRDGRKSKKMRSFLLPKRYFVNAPDPEKDRLGNFFAAIVCDDYTWVLCDFARLVQITLFARLTPWLDADLSLDSKVCPL